MEKILSCYNCSSSELKLFANVPDRHYGIKGHFTMSICNSCGLVFMDPMPSDIELANFYPQESYYSYHVDIFKKELWIKTFFRKILFLETGTNDPSFEKPGSILDIGCGNGWKLFEYKQKGWSVRGVEPSKVGSSVGNQAGLNIFNGDLLSAKFEPNSFDYIRSNHSFEHIHNPNDILQEIHKLLKVGGTLFIGVPNIGGYIAKCFKDYWYYLGAPVHTFNYDVDTLSQILIKNGFKVKKVNYSSNFAGILGSIQIYLNRGTDKSSENGFVFNFIPFRIIAGLVSKILNVLRKGDCIEIIATKNS